MDELEFDGKIYISAKRASREYKYTMDYVGQLIRGGKLIGKKVGRAWYVDAESIAAYTNQNGEQASSPQEINEPFAEEKEIVQEPIITQGKGSFAEISAELPVKTLVHKSSAEGSTVIRDEQNASNLGVKVDTKENVATESFVDEAYPPLRYMTEDEPELPDLLVKKESEPSSSVRVEVKIESSIEKEQRSQYAYRPSVASEIFVDRASVASSRVAGAVSRGSKRLAKALLLFVAVATLLGGSVLAAFVEKNVAYEDATSVASVSYSIAPLFNSFGE